MLQRSVAWFAGLAVLAASPWAVREATGHGAAGGSVRPPPQQQHKAPEQPHAGTSHTGNPSSSGSASKSPYGEKQQQPAHQPGNNPYQQHPNEKQPSQNPTHPGTANPAAGNPNSHPNMGTVRPPGEGPKTPTGQPQPNRPANPYGNTTVNNNYVNNGAMANKTNVGSVRPPYGTQTPYRTPYVNSLPTGYKTVSVGGTPYYYHGGNYYQPTYSGGSVVYAQTPPSQMNFSSTNVTQPTQPSQPPDQYQQPDPEQLAANSLNSAKVLLNENNPDAKAVALETLASTISTYPGTKAAGEAQALLKTIR